jgi:outer membrane protein OmpA-like peptidoglycan-associated protein
MTAIDKFNTWMTSTKGLLIQIAVFAGVANVIFYLLHIEHLPKMSLFESATAIASFGAISAIMLLVFASLMAMPALIFSALNMEINSKAGSAKIKNARWLTIVILETAIIFCGHLFFASYIGNTHLILAAAPALVCAGLLCWIARRQRLGLQSLFHSGLAFFLCFIYLFLYALLSTSKDQAVWKGTLGILLPAILILSAPFIGGKLGARVLAFAILFMPIGFTFDIQKSYFFPKLSMKMTRQGSFLVEKLVLDKKGCQIISNNPARECVSDTYYVCSAYFLSRAGDPNLIRILHHDRTGSINTKEYEIPSTSVLGMTMDKERRLLDEEDIDNRMEKLAQRCNFPTRFVLDGLFSLKESDLDENARRRIIDALSAVLTSGMRPPLRIMGYADESGLASENFGLSQERATKVRDFVVSLGYPLQLISVSAEGALKPINNCKKSTAQGKYDCGRINRRVEIEVENF